MVLCLFGKNSKFLEIIVNVGFVHAPSTYANAENECQYCKKTHFRKPKVSFFKVEKASLGWFWWYWICNDEWKITKYGLEKDIPLAF